MPSIKMSPSEIDAKLQEWADKGIEFTVQRSKAFTLPDRQPNALDAFVEKTYAGQTMETPWVCVTIPIKIESRDNMSANWRARSAMVRRQHMAAELALSGVTEIQWTELAKGCRIKLTRISPGTLDKDDNLRGAFKALKDYIALRLFGGRMGKRDDDPRASWSYDQLKAPPKVYGAIVTITVV